MGTSGGKEHGIGQRSEFQGGLGQLTAEGSQEGKELVMSRRGGEEESTEHGKALTGDPMFSF